MRQIDLDNGILPYRKQSRQGISIQVLSQYIRRLCKMSIIERLTNRDKVESRELAHW